MAAGDKYILAVNQNVNAVNVANVYAFEQLTDVTPGAEPEDSLIEAFLEHLTPLQAAMSSDAWANTCLTCRKHPVSGGGVQFFKNDTTAGTVVQPANASTTCCVATLYTDTATRRGRGRKFFAGVPITANRLGRLNNASIVDFTAFLDRLIQIISWSADNADFIIRVISTVDNVSRAVLGHHPRVALRKLSSRVDRVC